MTKENNKPEEENDPRLLELRNLVSELCVERVQEGLECLRNRDARASLFFQDAIDACEALNELLQALGYESECMNQNE
jgi:hypothetical protein